MNHPITLFESTPRLTYFFKKLLRQPLYGLLLLFLTGGSFSALAGNGGYALTSDTTVAATICANETYLFDGQLLDMTGEYKAVFVGADGSDSTVTLQLTVLPLLTETVNATICAGQTYPFFGLELDMSGQYDAVLTGSNGCDSTVTLNLTVLPNGNSNLNVGICTGSYYIYQGDTLTDTGTYMYTLTAANGCDSLVRLRLDVVDYFDVQLNPVICNGETYEFGGVILDASGVYVDSLTAIGGCDSVVTLTLTILPPQQSDVFVSICEGSYYIFQGDTLEAPGLYVYPLTGSYGCDSLVQLHFDVVPFFEKTAEATICQGETYTFGTQELTTDGEYKETFIANGGCDSTVTLILTVLPTSSGVDSATICDGGFFLYQGDELTQPGDYEYVLQGSNGCDSTVIFTLTVLESPNTVLEAVICHNGSFFFYGETLTEAGIYEHVFPAANGCDSTISLILSVLPELSTSLEAAICAGETYDFNGELLDTSGTYTQVLLSEYACDSTVTLHLTVFPLQSTTLDITLCAGESYEFDGTLLADSGTYTVVLPDENGCDSTVTLHLEVLPEKATSIEASICEGTTYAFNGSTLNTEGTYTAVLPGELGCDSTITLTLTVLPTHTTVIDTTICEGSGYNYFGQVLTESGSYEFGLTGENGCDSTVIVNIEVKPLQYGSLDAEICYGESYDFNGVALTETGSFPFVFPGANGCDSIFIVYLTVHPVSTTTLNVVACEGQTYDFNGLTLTTSGSYIAEYTSIYGCDSSIVLNLTFANFFESSLDAIICAGESFTFGTQTLTAGGVYTETYSTAGGCDSLVTLTLTVLPTSTSESNVAICAGESYNFNGEQYTTDGTYTAVLSGANGCDSTAVLHLTVLPKSESALAVTICGNESYPFNGALLDETGVYTGVLSGANGCDSIITLTLTVLPTLSGSAEATVCAGETYNFNGVILNESGAYTTIYTAANGCDSVVTLALTVRPVQQGGFAAVVCDGASFEFNGEILTQSGVYEFTLEGGAFNGCDSVAILFLTISPAIPPTTVSATICAGDTYEINGQSLNVSGQYTFELSSSTGCDSLVTLNLTVLPSVGTALSESICQGDTLAFAGQLLTAPGVYTQNLQSQSGCDSVITLTLSVVVLPPPVVTLNNGTLIVVGGGNLMYQWIDCATNAPIPGANNSTYTPTVSGQYAVVATNAHGCTEVSTCVTVVIVAVHEPLAAADWTLQPNPARAYASVVLKSSPESDLWLEIFDPAGRLLHQQNVAAGSSQIDLDLSAYPDGILMVRLRGTDGVSSKLLMKGN